MEYIPVETNFPQPAEQAVHEPAADIRRISGILRRQYPLAILGAILAGALASAFLVIAQPSYQATIRILLDQEGNKLLTNDSSNDAMSATTADGYVATQIAVINSDLVARRVVNALNLSWDAEAKRIYSAPSPQKDDRVSKMTSEELATADTDPNVVAAVLRSVTAEQIEKSQVIEIGVKDTDPALAQKMVAAYGRAYLDDQLSARYEATRNAGAWLEKRINTLRDQSLEANTAVEKFRAENNLIATDGRLVSDQQLQQLNEQLSTAQGAVTRAAAKVLVFEDALKKHDVDAVVSQVANAADVSENAPIRVLRNDYLQASGRLQAVAARWGNDNDQVKAVTAEVQRLSGLILDEANRILEGYRADLQVARSEAKFVADAASKATGQSRADSSTLVTLRSLEQRSASYNSLYQDYLSRYQEAIQQQTLALSNARLISKPEEPNKPVFPNKKVVLALSLVLGVGAGGMLGVGRELLDRTFRSRHDVEKQGVDFLGYVTEAGGLKGARWSRASAKAGGRADLAALARQLQQSRALTTTRLALEIRRRAPHKVIGFISLQPSACRSALALAFAEKEARAGTRVLLLDSDGQDGELSRTLLASAGASAHAPSAPEGTAGTTALRLASGVDFIPVPTEPELHNATGSDAVERLRSWREVYDLVVVNLPPAGPISEARALASSFDAFVCVIDWRRTDQQLLSALLQSSSTFAAKIAGVLVAGVNRRKLRLYDAEAAAEMRAA